MPDTYTKEQIDGIIGLLGLGVAGELSITLDWEEEAILLSALSAAEQERDFLKERERDICKAVEGISDGGQYRADIITHLQSIYEKAKERDTLREWQRQAVEWLKAEALPNLEEKVEMWEGRPRALEYKRQAAEVSALIAQAEEGKV